MSTNSEKETMIEFLIEEAADEILLNGQTGIDDEVVEEILDELDENLSIVMGCSQNMPSSAIPYSDTVYNNILPMSDEDGFRQMLRVGRKEFGILVDLIKKSKEYTGTKRNSDNQIPIELQLAIVLFRLGTTGNSATIRNTASIFGVGDGGTISNITNKIFRLFLSLQSRYIYWPNVTERSQIVSDTFYELPFCIGYIDTTEIQFADPPIENHESYLSRNNMFSIKAQVVCDYKRKIRHVVVGHPGSWLDAQIYRNSSLFNRKEQHFSSQQWIAGDSAYPLSDTLITPYKSNAIELDRNARIAFNSHHSKYRIRVEHCCSLLKKRFRSLKELRLRISKKEHHELCCNWFLVCCILHNILVDLNLSYFKSNLMQPTEDEDSADPEEAPNSDGEAKRQAIYALLFT